MARRAALACSVLCLVACAGLKTAPPTTTTSEADAGDVDAAPASTFCDGVTPTPDACFDFDRSAVVVEGWANANRNPDIGASGGGVIAEELDTVSSAPRAASLSLPALADSTFFASAILNQGLAAPLPANLTVEFEMLIATEYFATDGLANFLLLSYDGAAEIGVLRRDTGTWITIGKTSAAKLTTPIVVGSWATFTIVVENRPVNGADGRVQVFVNHRRAADLALPARLQTATEEQLDIGPVAKGPIGAFKMVVDNVRTWRRSDL